MSINCTECGEPIPPAARTCLVSGVDAGFPNVRRANSEAEREALRLRVERAQVSSRATGTFDELVAFGKAVGGSKVVMNRSLGALHTWVCGMSPLFLTFHKQVSGAGRIPQDNIWDDQRKSAENTVNPHYFEELSIGALTLTEVGMSYYGPYSVLLGENFISQRTTVFEENPFIFNQRMQIISGQACPLGYRATWDRRADLAVAKLGAKIQPKMDLAAFSELLLTSSLGDSDDADFVEAQIYGPVHVRTISHVTGPVPRKQQDRLLWNAVKRSLKKLGASWSEQ